MWEIFKVHRARLLDGKNVCVGVGSVEMKQGGAGIGMSRRTSLDCNMWQVRLEVSGCGLGGRAVRLVVCSGFVGFLVVGVCVVGLVLFIRVSALRYVLIFVFSY